MKIFGKYVTVEKLKIFYQPKNRRQIIWIYLLFNLVMNFRIVLITFINNKGEKVIPLLQTTKEIL
jgi:hypothetical protein